MNILIIEKIHEMNILVIEKIHEMNIPSIRIDCKLECIDKELSYETSD